MRSIEHWLAPALIAALALAGASVAQAPGQKGVFLKGRFPPSHIPVEDIVERVMAFDKNKDGKVTRDELPERMHHLIALGDTNKDGALDRDEIRKLVTTLPPPPGGFGGRAKGFGGFGTFSRVGGGPLGPGPGGLVGPGPGGLIGPGPVGIEGVVDDLKLPGKKKDQAMAAVKAHHENVRKLMDQARDELMQKMKEILSEEELNDFRAALDRPRGATFIDVGPLGPSRGGVTRKLDPPQE
jgi:hypothetical protein